MHTLFSEITEAASAGCFFINYNSIFKALAKSTATAKATAGLLRDGDIVVRYVICRFHTRFKRRGLCSWSCVAARHGEIKEEKGGLEARL